MTIQQGIPACLSSLLESRLTLKMKHSYEEQARAYRIIWEMKMLYAGEDGILLLRKETFVMWILKSSRLSYMEF